MVKGFWNKLENPNSNFTFNLVVLSLVLFVIVLCAVYVIRVWDTPDKIYLIIGNFITLLVGLLGGKALSKNGDK